MKLVEDITGRNPTFTGSGAPIGSIVHMPQSGGGSRNPTFTGSGAPMTGR